MHVTIVPSTTPLQATPSCRWPDEAACSDSAQALARTLRPALQQGASVIIELRGTLGAGKTTFTRHLLRALGVTGRIKSPSYAVVEPHQAGDIAIWHFDFYRFNDPAEWEDAGFRDLFASAGLKLVEWPDQAGDLLPPADICIDIRPESGDIRAVSCHSESAAGHAWLNAWVHDAQALPRSPAATRTP